MSNTQHSHTYRFTALDTLFFRESRPMESVGGSELNSVFPPPIRTLSGALRSCIAESQPGWDWSMMKCAESELAEPLRQVKYWIDDVPPDDESLLHFDGVWTRLGRERIYPAPAYLVAAMQFDELQSVAYLSLSTPQHCDLGQNIRLPELPDEWVSNEAAYPKPRGLEQYWVRENDLKRILRGELDLIGKPEQVFIKDAAIYSKESRLGVAIDNHTRKVQESMLYQTAHIRPAKTVSFEIDVHNLPPELAFAKKANRTGGEGRITQLEKMEVERSFEHPMITEQTARQGVVLCSLTPFCTQGSYLPFDDGKGGQVTEGSWTGKVNGVAIRVHAMVSGRVHREGGWNMKRHRPRNVKSYLPAGTCWYCTIEEEDLSTALKQLHYKKIGQETHLGRGCIVVGQSPVKLSGVSTG